MRICVILEGCYPYVTGGVSSWMHQYIQAMPEHEFVLWTLGASSESRGQFRYELPENVVEVHEVFLQDALKLPPSRKRYKFNQEEITALTEFVHCGNPDWNVLFRMYNDDKMAPMAFLMSEEFLVLARTPDGQEREMSVQECAETGSTFIHVVSGSSLDDLDALLAYELRGIKRITE